MASTVEFSTIGFFNSIMPLNQTNWAAYFSPIMKDGIIADIGDEMNVYSPGEGMVIKVGSGECRVRSHRGVLDEEITLDIAPADPTYMRRDLVVARVTYGDPSTMVVAVKTGVPSESPSTPDIEQVEGVIWEISLASIAIPANATRVNPTNVFDTRYVYNQLGETVIDRTQDGISYTSMLFPLENNVQYQCRTPINTLILTFPENPRHAWHCTVNFTSYSTFNGVSFESYDGTTYTPKKKGDALNTANKRYHLELFWDGEYFWCNTMAA